MQEVANSRAALAYCGAKYVQARFLSLAPLLIGIVPEAHCQAVLDIFPGPARKDSWWGQSRDLYTLLRNFGRSEAQDERDMIYALLGMLSDTDKSDMLRPDYEKTAQELSLDVIHSLYFDKIDLEEIDLDERGEDEIYWNDIDWNDIDWDQNDWDQNDLVPPN